MKNMERIFMQKILDEMTGVELKNLQLQIVRRLEEEE